MGVTPVGAVARTSEQFDAAGGAVIPGLHDHHVHLASLAAARNSTALGPPHVVDETSFATALRDADRRLPPASWLRGTGYHESVAGRLDRAALDRLVPNRAVRIQHRSGALWILNSRGVAAVGLADSADGRFFGSDDWLRDRFDGEAPDLEAACSELIAFGVTGVTDLTPTERIEDVKLLMRGDLPLRIRVTGGPRLPPLPSVRPVAVKLLLADHALPSLHELEELVREAHGRGLPVAVHSVTIESLVLAIAAWVDAGSHPGDRLEHGAIVPPSQRHELAQLGVTVVTQPSFVAERGDVYLNEVDSRDLPFLYPCRSLLEAGVRVAFGTDAPFGPSDPWRAMRAATSRVTPTGASLGAEERIDGSTAVRCFLGPADFPGGPPRTLAPGGPADICVLRAPLGDALDALSSDLVAATLVGGRLVYVR
jgi:predicted amidohydrolase YtcJ